MTRKRKTWSYPSQSIFVANSHTLIPRDRGHYRRAKCGLSSAHSH
jgi:hypothetical protein